MQDWLITPKIFGLLRNVMEADNPYLVYFGDLH